MAAAAVAGIIPVLHSLAGDETSYYIGRKLWFGFLGLYTVVIYVERLPWISLNSDFRCHGNISAPCMGECFEQHFNKPIIGTWYMSCFLFLCVFLLMEFFVFQLRHKQIKVKAGQEKEVEVSSMVGVQEESQSQRSVPVIDFHIQKSLLSLYLFNFLLQLVIQSVFLSILLNDHLPRVNSASILCSTKLCPGPYNCLVMGSMEKRMSIYTLATLAILIIIFCSAIFIYSIHHYLLKGLEQLRARDLWLWEV
ncbi:uncharacterized protein LOC123367322 [Mauremys mutica]|uniref:uncharacterized protein LOC123367322 n=1 Tax=Mauremys mutica TaxID=74926 RepID=UPI001D1606DF|nr:uncharacterized protein LOC123367322 [Mauremys mutica]XP_044867427.1 uncharacterized protein LOC123367322 [Mauremys mutica]XP_044867428.1 uncharacterized protein LOC123367322 [Mauremys mutica]